MGMNPAINFIDRVLTDDVNLNLVTVRSSGETVLAKDAKCDWPTMYANPTQAYRKCATLRHAGFDVDVIQRGRPWYVRLNLGARPIPPPRLLTFKRIEVSS